MRGNKSNLIYLIKNAFIVLFFAIIFYGFYAYSIPKTNASFLERIPFSATMLDSNGSPIADSNYQVIFRFYAAATGGSSLWEETQTVTTEGGKFEILLGSITALASLNLDQTLFISIQVESDSEMAPRKQVGATPQALMAKKATGLVASDGGAIEAVGSLHVSLGLHIEGDATFEGNLIFGNGAQILQSGSGLSLSSSLLPNTSGLDLGSQSQNWSNVYAGTIDLKEIVAPTAMSGYGRLYTDATDHTLHFINTYGTDTSILSTGSSLKVQELVKDFTAESGENIAIGNLVSYINGKVRKGANVDFATSNVFNAFGTVNVSAVALSTDKIAVSYSDLGNSNYGTTIIGTISGTTVSWGAASVFESASTYDATNITPLNISSVALSSSKIAISYTDVGNSNFGTTIIGDVSGTNISWGSASVFASASTNFISTAQLSSDKIAISYSNIDNSDYGTSIIATIAGNVLTFGTPSVFESAATSYISSIPLSSDKIAISYSDSGNSDYGTSIIGTITGSSFSFGTAVVFESAMTVNISSAALSVDKIAISYSDFGNNEYGTAIIGSITGNVPTFGTASVYRLYSTYDVLNSFIANSSVVAISSNKIVINYQDHGNSKYGYSVIGDISGLSITWSNPNIFENMRSEFISAVVLSPNKLFVGYQDAGNSNIGTFTIGNLTPYVGVSKNACIAGQICNIAIKGVVSGLSSLSTGAVYYAGANGVLTIVPYPNRVGTAVSTTEILLDGKWDSGDMMVSDLIFNNSFRLTEFQNSSGSQGIAMYDQNTKPILQLSESGKLALIGASVGTSYTEANAPSNGLIVEGNVGIGMSLPTAKLHVTGSTGTVGIELSSNESVAGNNIMVLRSDITTDENAVFRVQADGAVYADGAFTGGGADYAEYFANEEVIAPTMLVGLNKASGKVRKYQAGDKIIGVVSNTAGFIGNSTDAIEKDPAYTLVALMGQVSVDPSQVNTIDGTVYTLDGIQIGHSLLGNKVLIDVIAPNVKIDKLMMSFDQDGALVLGAGSKLYSKTDGLLVLEGSLEILKNLYVKGKIITPAGDIQYLTADSIIASSSNKIKVAGKDEAVILTGEQIEAGEDGQNLIIQGSDDTNTVALQNYSVLESSKIKLGAESRTIGKGDILTLTYDLADGFWYEVSFADN